MADKTDKLLKSIEKDRKRTARGSMVSEDFVLPNNSGQAFDNRKFREDVYIGGDLQVIGSSRLEGGVVTEKITSGSNQILRIYADGSGYNIVGESGLSTHALAGGNDLLVRGQLEVDGTLYADGNAEFTGSITKIDVLRPRLRFQLKGTNYGMSEDTDCAIFKSVSLANTTITLPEAADCLGAVVIIGNLDPSWTVTVSCQGSDVLDKTGNTNATLAQDIAITLMAIQNDRWYIISTQGRPTYS